jgi:hypothetical protein
MGKNRSAHKKLTSVSSNLNLGTSKSLSRLTKTHLVFYIQPDDLFTRNPLRLATQGVFPFYSGCQKFCRKCLAL